MGALEGYLCPRQVFSAAVCVCVLLVLIKFSVKLGTIYCRYVSVWAHFH